jgi:hypothetical protein
VEIQSYSDLHGLIKKQILDGKVISDRKSGTASDTIEEWITMSTRCLAHMEGRVPALREVRDLDFYRRIPEEDVISEVVEEEDKSRTVQIVDEDEWSKSWFRDGGDHAIDFNFHALQRAVELLELADEKLQLDSASVTAQDVSAPSLSFSTTGSKEGTDGSGCEASLKTLNRHDQVDSFLCQCTDEANVKIRRNHIWRAVKHKTARQFQYWQNLDDKATDADNLNFGNILAFGPAKFVAKLKKSGLI